MFFIPQIAYETENIMKMALELKLIAMDGKKNPIKVSNFYKRKLFNSYSLSLNFCNIFSTCACGKWICTSKLCGSYNQDNPSSSYESKNEEEKQYEDMDNQID